MPELPDLTVYAKNLRPQVCGKPIACADVFNRAKVGVAPETFRQTLVGQCVSSIERDGKELRLTLASGDAFNVHLMLFGRFSLLPWLDLHRVNSKIMAIGFEDGQALAVSDPKGMCRVRWNPPASTVPDALDPSLTPERFQQMLRAKSGMNIKALLIDPKIIRGIGNAYVDEILWRADISPKSIAGRIPPDAAARLYAVIGATLRDAIEQIEHISPHIISGEERSFLVVHQTRTKETPDGDPILCEEIAGKRTYYTPNQRLFI